MTRLLREPIGMSEARSCNMMLDHPDMAVRAVPGGFLTMPIAYLPPVRSVPTRPTSSL